MGQGWIRIFKKKLWIHEEIMNSDETLQTENQDKCFVVQPKLGKVQEFREERLFPVEASLSEVTVKARTNTKNNY